MSAAETLTASRQDHSTDQAEPMLEIAGVSRVFPDGSGLNPVEISVRPGEFISVLGPSGCGKSTLLRCVAGLETPQTGTISIDGREVFRASGASGAPGTSGTKSLNTPPARRGLSMVFQDLALWPHMSVADNVEFPLTVKAPGRPRVAAKERAERTADALETVGLSAKADQRPSALSGGQQQRVAIARAIISRPGLILMDEPLSALDAALRDQMRREITDLARTLGLTILYVTHDQQEAMSMADRVLVLNEGRIAQFAPPAEIYERPADAFVADFVGTMNRVDDLAVRPEQVTVTAGTTATTDAAAADAPLTDSARRLTSTVLSCQYVGGRYELRCDVDGAPHPWLVYDGHDHDAGTEIQLVVNG